MEACTVTAMRRPGSVKADSTSYRSIPGPWGNEPHRCDDTVNDRTHLCSLAGPQLKGTWGLRVELAAHRGM